MATRRSRAADARSRTNVIAASQIFARAGFTARTLFVPIVGLYFIEVFDARLVQKTRKKIHCWRMGYQPRAAGTQSLSARGRVTKALRQNFRAINSTPRNPRQPKNFSRLVNVLHPERRNKNATLVPRSHQSARMDNESLLPDVRRRVHSFLRADITARGSKKGVCTTLIANENGRLLPECGEAS